MAEAGRGPRVSVVIPVKDRRSMLAACLDALEAQTYRDFEVVVVDDGSGDGSGDDAARRPGVRVLHATGSGAVAARLQGVAAAAGDILAFTDSDCVPSPDWLATAVRAVDAGADLVSGLTHPARALLPLERSMASATEGLYPTCNAVYRRDAYDACGGFDAAAAGRWGFRPDKRSRGAGFGEDTLLGWRVARRGLAVYEPRAVVAHAVFAPDYAELISRNSQVGAFPSVLKEIPELRDSSLVRWGWQFGRRTRVPAYAFALTLAGRRRRLATGCLAWWAAARLQDLRAYPIPWRRRLAVLPVEMVVDVVTGASLIAGSLRSRSILL